jgi:Tfp pilus assembly protein FimV
MVRVNKTMMKMVFFLVVIMVTLMSGALLHAYAGSGTNHSTVTVSQLPSNTHPATATIQTKPVNVTKRTVDVCPGDTLWDIASSHMPDGENVRSYMNKIKKLNGMKNADLKSGQILILP